MICTPGSEERLNAMQVTVWLGVSYSEFCTQVREGIWDGTYVIEGKKAKQGIGDKRFLPKLVIARQEQMVKEAAAHAARERRKAA